MAIAAVVLAALAFFGVILFANSANQRAYKNAELVKVFKVEKQIPKGLAADQAISQGYIKDSQIPQEFKPGTAVVRTDEIKNKVALYDISPGTILVAGQFVDPNVAQVTTAQQVKTGQVAVTISVDQVHGVAGLLMPGDKVNIMSVGGAGGAGTTNKQIATMYQNVEVMAIGSKTAPQAGGSSASADESGDSSGQKQQAAGDAGLITFSVPLEAAERIALGASGGPDGSHSLYLTLVPPDNQPVSVPKVGGPGASSYLDGIPLTPYN